MVGDSFKLEPIGASRASRESVEPSRNEWQASREPVEVRRKSVEVCRKSAKVRRKSVEVSGKSAFVTSSSFWGLFVKKKIRKWALVGEQFTK